MRAIGFVNDADMKVEKMSVSFRKLVLLAGIPVAPAVLDLCSRFSSIAEFINRRIKQLIARVIFVCDLLVCSH